MKSLLAAVCIPLIMCVGCSQKMPPKERIATTNRATPSPDIRVFQSDSEEEKEALAEEFLGVTADGKVETGLYSITATGISTAPIKLAVENFLDALSPDQRALCRFPIESKEWRRWTNIDVGLYKRKGIGLADLSDEQKGLALGILKESLSPKGFHKTQDIMKMEDYLARLSNKFEDLGHDFYWFTFMGEPSETEPWGWQFDGHHLVINYFILGDQVVMTPTFMGSEPTYIEEGKNTGTRTFEAEEELGIAFYNSLNKEQKAEATLHNRKEYDNNQAESFRDNAVIPYVGLKASTLDEQQLKGLTSLIREFVENMREGHAKVKMEEVQAYMEDTWFSWVGAMDGSGPFYYRIHSPVILIEFDHHRPVFLKGKKPSKKHVHTVVRSPNGNDYGKDLLKQHLQEHAH